MGELYKHRIDKKGKILSTESANEANDFRGNIRDRVKKEMDAQQGCHFQGYIKVYRVPGNFHIATHAMGDIYMMLKNEGFKFDFGYVINHVSFGNKKHFDYISKKFTDLYMEHPMDGISELPEYKDGGATPKGMKSMFYIVAVPSYFEKHM